jgi:Alcohol dehydrogenase GroES-like domain
MVEQPASAMSPGRLRKQENSEMTNDTATYRAVQAVAPGRLELTTKPLREPPPGYVRIRVEACGVCHSDAGTVAGMFPISWPRVPGHEVIGRIDALGEGVQGWTLDSRIFLVFAMNEVACTASRAIPARAGQEANPDPLTHRVGTETDEVRREAAKCPSWVCAVTRRRFPVGARPTRRFAPAGSNRSSHGGNEMAEAFE